jgi:hypothetical protein
MPGSSSSLSNMAATHSLKHQEILKLFNSTGFDFFRKTEEGESVLDMVQNGNGASPINNYVRNAGHTNVVVFFHKIFFTKMSLLFFFELDQFRFKMFN